MGSLLATAFRVLSLRPWTKLSMRKMRLLHAQMAYWSPPQVANAATMTNVLVCSAHQITWPSQHKASTTFVYHLSGLGYEAHDHYIFRPYYT